jgi:hypothetical protein
MPSLWSMVRTINQGYAGPLIDGSNHLPAAPTL